MKQILKSYLIVLFCASVFFFLVSFVNAQTYYLPPPEPLFFEANNTIKSMKYHAGKLYIGGDFTELTIRDSDPVQRYNTPYFAVIDIASQEITSGPSFNVGGAFGVGRTVNDIEIDAVNDRILLGGEGLQIGDPETSPSYNLVALSLSSLELDDTWEPSTSGPVNDIELHTEVVYIGGEKDNATEGGYLESYNRINLAKTNYELTVTSSDVNVSYGTILTIEAVGDRIFIGGIFNFTDGEVNPLSSSLAMLNHIDNDTVTISQWAPLLPFPQSSHHPIVESIESSADGNTLYAGGRYPSSGSVSGANLTIFDISSPNFESFTRLPSPIIPHYVQSILLSSNAIYLTGASGTSAISTDGETHYWSFDGLGLAEIVLIPQETGDPGIYGGGIFWNEYLSVRDIVYFKKGSYGYSVKLPNEFTYNPAAIQPIQEHQFVMSNTTGDYLPSGGTVTGNTIGFRLDNYIPGENFAEEGDVLRLRIQMQAADGSAWIDYGSSSLKGFIYALYSSTDDGALQDFTNVSITVPNSVLENTSEFRVRAQVANNTKLGLGQEYTSPWFYLGGNNATETDITVLVEEPSPEPTLDPSISPSPTVVPTITPLEPSNKRPEEELLLETNEGVTTLEYVNYNNKELLIIGGYFTEITINGTTEQVNYIAAIDLETESVTNWRPVFEGDPYDEHPELSRMESHPRIFDIATDIEYQRLMVGGSFTTVEGQSRYGAVAFDLNEVVSGNSSGLLSWNNLSASADVEAIEIGEEYIYLGGDDIFNDLGPGTRIEDPGGAYFESFNRDDLSSNGTHYRFAFYTGNLRSGTIYAIEDTGDRVFVGGYLNSVDEDNTYSGIAMLRYGENPGELVLESAWRPNLLSVNDITTSSSGQELYVAGSFSNVITQGILRPNSNRFAVFDLNSSNPIIIDPWIANLDFKGPISGIRLEGSTLYFFRPNMIRATGLNPIENRWKSVWTGVDEFFTNIYGTFSDGIDGFSLGGFTVASDGSENPYVYLSAKYTDANLRDDYYLYPIDDQFLYETISYIFLLDQTNLIQEEDITPIATPNPTQGQEVINNATLFDALQDWRVQNGYAELTINISACMDSAQKLEDVQSDFLITEQDTSVEIGGTMDSYLNSEQLIYTWAISNDVLPYLQAAYTDACFVNNGSVAILRLLGLPPTGVTPTSTPLPTNTLTNTPTNTPTPPSTEGITPSATPTVEVTPSPTEGVTPSATLTVEVTPSPTEGITPSATPTVDPEATATPTTDPSITPTITPSTTLTPTATTAIPAPQENNIQLTDESGSEFELGAIIDSTEIKVTAQGYDPGEGFAEDNDTLEFQLQAQQTGGTWEEYDQSSLKAFDQQTYDTTDADRELQDFNEVEVANLEDNTGYMLRSRVVNRTKYDQGSNVAGVADSIYTEDLQGNLLAQADTGSQYVSEWYYYGTNDPTEADFVIVTDSGAKLIDTTSTVATSVVVGIVFLAVTTGIHFFLR